MWSSNVALISTDESGELAVAGTSGDMEAMVADHAHTDEGDEAAVVVKICNHRVGQVSRGRGKPSGRGQGRSMYDMR